MFRRSREPRSTPVVEAPMGIVMRVEKNEMIEIRRDPYVVRENLDNSVKVRRRLLRPITGFAVLLGVPPIVAAPRDYVNYLLAAALASYPIAQFKGLRGQKRLLRRTDAIIAQRLPDAEAVKVEYENNIMHSRSQARTWVGAGIVGLVVGVAGIGSGIVNDRAPLDFTGSALTLVSAGITSSGRYRQRMVQNSASLRILSTDSGYIFENSKNASLVEELRNVHAMVNMHMHFSWNKAYVHVTTGLPLRISTASSSNTADNNKIIDLPHWDEKDQKR